MREFDYEKLKERKWDNEVLRLIGTIHEYKGRMETGLKQKPQKLERMEELARRQSTIASNEIEGIRTGSARLHELTANRHRPENQKEEEIIGYWNALESQTAFYNCTAVCSVLPQAQLPENSKSDRTGSVPRRWTGTSALYLHR